jgi:hypothetical protein
MAPKLVLLTSGELDDSDENIVKLVEFSGLDTHVTTAHEFGGPTDRISALAADNPVCLLVNAEFLREAFHDSQAFDAFKSYVFSTKSFVFVYNVFPDGDLNPAIEHFCDGAVRSVEHPDSSINTFHVADDDSGICQQFSGLSFQRRNNGRDYILSLGRLQDNPTPLISINGAPSFLRLSRANCTLYILATDSVLDIDKPALQQWDYKDHFLQFIPFLMFIRLIFRDRCWHNNHLYASFVIDDPLLRPRYGFLEYDSLLKSMDLNEFVTTVAFIPYNFRRSDADLARRLSERKDRIRICIHGCNHTGSEFGITDVSALNRLAKQATRRMFMHESLTGLEFDNVMVFPQGVFSSRATEVLKANGYLAAINTTPFSVDHRGDLRVSDLLDLAVMTHSCFPVFTRRYPRNVIDFAFDMFFGKPAVVVEHHDFLKGGYDRMSSFVRSMNGLCGTLKWAGVQHIVENSYLENTRADGTSQIRIYAGSCRIHNTSDRINRYLVMKRECGNVPIDSVTIDGKKTDFELNNGMVTISTELPPRSAIQLTIKYEDCYPQIHGDESRTALFRVWLRRRLSEFRDNRVNKSELLTSVLRSVSRIRRRVASRR